MKHQNGYDTNEVGYVNLVWWERCPGTPIMLCTVHVECACCRKISIPTNVYSSYSSGWLACMVLQKCLCNISRDILVTKFAVAECNCSVVFSIWLQQVQQTLKWALDCEINRNACYSRNHYGCNNQNKKLPCRSWILSGEEHALRCTVSSSSSGSNAWHTCTMHASMICT